MASKTTTTHTTVTETHSTPTEHQSVKKTLTSATGLDSSLQKKTYKYKTDAGEEVVVDLKDADVARPHARAVAGTALKSELTACTSTFTLEYLSSGAGASDATEIFVPYVHYPTGYRVTASDGHCTIEKHEGYDIVRHQPDKHDHKHRLVVERRVVKKDTTTSRISWFGHSNLPVYVALGVAIVTPYLAW
ncbi:hypothetical protein PHYBOEH_008769 [Phytophthora boehmeriae]|uniref:Glycoside hydrolase family 5 C-terminal domain-containing protein n=1 Tax=Phytophthora boehmeriae TaxID=109152 RepID=A0A8T1VY25_9STRA|nr:hypothetical protein PHYBOEH_008769 [Phytophthora boehmeriae]